MKTNIYSLEGNVAGEIELPAVFSEKVRIEVIRRAVISEQTMRYQPKGAYPFAGLETSARYRGRKEIFGSIKNHGISRLPREVLPHGKFGKVKRLPFAVKGRRAHPPRVAKVLIEKINKKEYDKAMKSAIAATADKDVVSRRGHAIKQAKGIPLIVENKLEESKKTKDVLRMLEALGINADLERSQNRKKRSGVRENRKGGYTTPKSVLIVVGEDRGLCKAAGNIAGVDAVTVEKLKVELLAPGTQPGRLTIWSKGAIEKLAKM
ncbi:MAG: 50S ribosomal protein L4 [Candidatus Micrarchaeota archaeon]